MYAQRLAEVIQEPSLRLSHLGGEIYLILKS